MRKEHSSCKWERNCTDCATGKQPLWTSLLSNSKQNPDPFHQFWPVFAGGTLRYSSHQNKSHQVEADWVLEVGGCQLWRHQPLPALQSAAAAAIRHRPSRLLYSSRLHRLLRPLFAAASQAVEAAFRGGGAFFWSSGYRADWWELSIYFPLGLKDVHHKEREITCHVILVHVCDYSLWKTVKCPTVQRVGEVKIYI